MRASGRDNGLDRCLACCSCTRRTNDSMARDEKRSADFQSAFRLRLTQHVEDLDAPLIDFELLCPSPAQSRLEIGAPSPEQMKCRQFRWSCGQPEWAKDNSPAFQRGNTRARNVSSFAQVLPGTAERRARTTVTGGSSAVPDGTGACFRTPDPPLKGWAIFNIYASGLCRIVHSCRERGSSAIVGVIEIK